MSFVTDETRRADNGKLRTASLFVDMQNTDGDRYPPVFTLKNVPHAGLPSIYQEFMKHESEYDAAMALLGSWQHWTYLREIAWFAPLVKSWCEELEMREKARAKRQLLKAAEEGNVTAQKLLYTGEQSAAPKKRTKAQREKDTASADHASAIDKLYKESPLNKTH